VRLNRQLLRRSGPSVLAVVNLPVCLSLVAESPAAVSFATVMLSVILSLRRPG